MVRLKHGLICVSRILKHGLCPCFKRHTEGHALTYLKYVAIATFDLGPLYTVCIICMCAWRGTALIIMVSPIIL